MIMIFNFLPPPLICTSNIKMMLKTLYILVNKNRKL